MTTEKKYKNIIFDWDGCLAKTLDIWMSGYKETFLKYGLKPLEKEIVEKCYGRWDGPKNFGITDFIGFYDQMMPAVRFNLETVDLYPQVWETLRTLKSSGKRMAILSTSERYYVEKAINHNGLQNIFEASLFGDEVTKHKPDPEPILKIVASLGIDLSDTVIVGDSDKDILAAQNAGIDSVLFYPEENEKFYLKLEFIKLGPNFVIRHFGELLKIL
ncbi:MAG: HAD family hydrolase [Patescibacteria group bacterium]|nr:HAD family hydrolase [Patescibacteria group bacterium]